jgi:hypothetical protein
MILFVRNLPSRMHGSTLSADMHRFCELASGRSSTT